MSKRQQILAPNRWRHSIANRVTLGSYKVPNQIIDACKVQDGQKRSVTFITQKGNHFTLDASIASGCEILLPKKYHANIKDNEYAEITIRDFIVPSIAKPELFPDVDEEFIEGRTVLRIHLAKERDRNLVKLAKAIALSTRGELRCEVCKLSFQERYGDIGRDFIEAHHLLPVSQLKTSTRVRIEDIALLCSNCHRMIHRGNPVFSIEELRTKLK